jgi:hypothetical protein
MKQLGNLAVVCAKRTGVLLQILDGKATLYAGFGSNRQSFMAEWDDDEQISSLIRELNYGKLSEEDKNDTEH